MKIEKELEEKRLENAIQQDIVRQDLANKATKLAKKEARKIAKQKESDEMPSEFVHTPARHPTVLNKPKEVSEKSSGSDIKTAEVSESKNIDQPKSGWAAFKSSVKQGTEHACTQAETAMGQCR